MSEIPKTIANKVMKCPFISTCVKFGINTSTTRFDHLKKLCPYLNKELKSDSRQNYNEIFDSKIEEKKESETYRVFNRIGRLADSFTRADCFRTDTKISESLGKKTVSVWCSNDYLGMSSHSKVKEASIKAIEKFGVGSGGTRNISGNNPLHELLEATLAEWYKKEAGLLFTSCYVANSTTLTTLAKLLGNCIIFSDQGNHASMIEGIRNSKCEKIIYRHNDITDLQTKLSSSSPDIPKVIAFESVNSMNGSVAPMRDICILAKKYNALTFVDEVHAVGLYGKLGSGLSEELECLNDIDIISGTLGKAVGSIGGFIVGKANLVDAIRCYAPGLIFTTSLPPSVVAASIESIKILKSEEGVTLRNQHQSIVSAVRNCITHLGIPLFPSPSHIIPVLVGNSSLCKKIGKYMMDEYNIYVQPINYPTVKFGTERLRIAPTPHHKIEDVELLLNALDQAWSYVGLEPKHPKCHNFNCNCLNSCSSHRSSFNEISQNI